MYILLVFCTDGMSTSLLGYRMESAAKKLGVDCTIETCHISSLNKYIVRDADMILIGPQDRFQYNNLKKLYAPTPIEVVDARLYGTMNGEKVLEQARQVLQRQE